MGCFNTKGWLSHLQMRYDEDIFCTICIGLGHHTKNMRPIDGDGTNSYRPYGQLFPIAFPIFGKYDSYGRICNIERTENVKRIEEFFGESIETIIGVIDSVTTIFGNYYDCPTTRKKLELYESFRDRLGLNDDYLSTFEPHLHKKYDMHIVLTYDFKYVYDSMVELMKEDVTQGLYRSRKNYSNDNKIKEYWEHIYLEKYPDNENDKYKDIPSIYSNKEYGKFGGIYNGWCDWWNILMMYKDPLQLDVDNQHIPRYSEKYDEDKEYVNLEKLLYDESLEPELINFMSFLWFCHKSYISIDYSYPTAQDDINDKIIQFYKKLGQLEKNKKY